MLFKITQKLVRFKKLKVLYFVGYFNCEAAFRAYLNLICLTMLVMIRNYNVPRVISAFVAYHIDSQPRFPIVTSKYVDPSNLLMLRLFQAGLDA